MEKKLCRKCNTVKPVSLFSRRKFKTKIGYQPYCKKCNSILMKELYDKGPRKRQVRAWNRKKRKFLKGLAISYKLKKGCKICGYNKNPYALDFHHLNSKSEDISRLVGFGTSEKRLMEEMSKCIVLCANCHRELHHPYVPIV